MSILLPCLHLPAYLLPISIHQSFYLHPLLLTFLPKLQVRLSWRWEKLCLWVQHFRKEKNTENELDFQKKFALNPFVLSLSCSIHVLPELSLALLSFYFLTNQGWSKWPWGIKKKVWLAPAASLLNVCVCVWEGETDTFLLSSPIALSKTVKATGYI